MTHSHSFDPREEAPSALRQAAAQRSTWVSVAVNVLLSSVQVVVGFWANSQALVADGVHSLSDLVSDFVVLFANRHSAAEADANHPYGHGRFETAASLVIGMLLLSVGAGMLWSAGHKIQDPSQIPAVHSIALWVAGLALVCKELLFRYMLRVAEAVKSSMLVANAWHARSDAASFLVVGRRAAGSPLFPCSPLFRAQALVGFMIGHMGWKFSWSALSDLMDRGLSEDELDAIRATLKATPGVRGVHDLRTRRMGDLAMVDAHLLVDGYISVSEGHYIAAIARQHVLQAHRVLDVLVHIDPEDDSGHSAQMLALPHRQRIEQALSEVLDDTVRAQVSLKLHYLHGEIELEAVLDPHACQNQAEREALAYQLHALTHQIAGLGRVRVHHTLDLPALPSPPAALDNAGAAQPAAAGASPKP